MTAKGRLLTEAKLNDIDYHLVVITERVYKVNDDYDKYCDIYQKTKYSWHDCCLINLQ